MTLAVLVVDDARLMRLSLKTSLQESPGLLWLGEAENGLEALALLAHWQKTSQPLPQVVIMDIGMPQLDGIQTTLKLKALYPQIRVLMLTSHEREADILEAFRCGASSYCLKETAPQRLMDIVAQTAEGACWIDPKVAQVVLNNLGATLGATLGASLGPILETPVPQEPVLAETVLNTPPLTDRELEVLRALVKGLNNTQIADTLFISLNTVKTHLKNIFQKLGVDDRTGAVLHALRHQLLPPV